MLKIDPSELVDLADLAADNPARVDLVYARADHPENVFGTAFYRADARMWGHRDMAVLVALASHICFDRTGWTFELKDCLRPVEAQAAMRETEIVKQNPHWLEEPNRLLSPPGKGGHPRGMAIDIILRDERGDAVDMGTPFDHLTRDPSQNPAARNWTRFCADEARNQRILYNRRALEESMMEAAARQGRALLPLPQEWWDFRFLRDYTEGFAPIHDADLPPAMRMTM